MHYENKAKLYSWKALTGLIITSLLFGIIVFMMPSYAIDSYSAGYNWNYNNACLYDATLVGYWNLNEGLVP